MKNTTLAIISLLFIALHNKAQDPTFSQFFNIPQYSNPAYSGIDNGVKAGISYRNQWRSLSGQFNTGLAFTDMSIRRIRAGLGLLLLSDRTGNKGYNTNSVMFNLQKLIKLQDSEKRLVVAYFGMQLGMAQKKLDWNHLIFSDQLDPTLGLVDPSSANVPQNLAKSYADLGSGFLLRYKNRKTEFYSALGGAVLHLNKPNQSFYGTDSKLPIKWNIHYIAKIPLKYLGIERVKRTFLSPFAFVEKQGYSEQIDLGLKFQKEFFYAGASYRFKRMNLVGKKVDALVFHLGLTDFIFDNKYRWQLGYSYDATISRLKTATSGTHEISLTLEFDKLNIKRICIEGPGYITMPDFRNADEKNRKQY